MTADEPCTIYEDKVIKFKSLLDNKKYEEAYSLFEENPEVIQDLTLSQLRNYYQYGFRNKVAFGRIKKLKLTIEKIIFEDISNLL